MAAKYELWLSSDRGYRLESLNDAKSFWYAEIQNDVGAWEMVLPGDHPTAYIKPDQIVEIWRQPDGGVATAFIGFIEYIETRTDSAGNKSRSIGGGCKNALLSWRIVAYAAGSAQAEKTDQADDMIKAVFSENYIAATDATRNISILQVQANSGDGPSITMGFSRDEVLDTLKAIADSASQEGTPVFFGLEPLVQSDGSLKLELRTSIEWYANDGTVDNGGHELSVERGTLAEPELLMDYRAARSYVYAGGQGGETARTVKTAENTTMSGQSIWGRKEAWRDARDKSADDAVQGAADDEIEKLRPVLRLKAKVMENQINNRFGVEWRCGSRMTAQYDGYTFDGLIKSVMVRKDENGDETISANIEAELTL